MKKLFRGLLGILLGLFIISSFGVKADGPVLKSIDGASIRTKTEESKQGLRFYAELNDEALEHGFYVAFGKASVEELKAALNDEVPKLNGKVVHKTSVPGINNKNQFSVVLVGIPEVGYLDKISVFPYVVIDGEEVFSEVVDRSIGEVALKAANIGNDIGSDIISYIEENVKRVAFDAFGNISVIGSSFELNPLLLKEEFIKDWNAKFNTNWEDLDADKFHQSATTGSVKENLGESNLYKFFNDPLYKDKWEFVLDAIIKVDEDRQLKWPKVQAEALKSDGTSVEANLYGASHLNYSIANFFNTAYDSGGYNPADFRSISTYEGIEDKLVSIYIDANKYDFYHVGDDLTLEEPASIKGYQFKHYKKGAETFALGDVYEVTSANEKFEPVYEATEYDVEFYLDGDKLNELKLTYTINDEVVLDPLVKAGYAFEGWYDNALFDGDPVEVISKGSTGDKIYYAKAIQSEYVNVEVTFKLNDGMLATAADLAEYQESVNVVATRYTTAIADSGGKPINVNHTGGTAWWHIMGFKESDVAGVFEFVGKGTAYKDDAADLYISYHDSIESPFAAVIKDIYNNKISSDYLLVIPELPEAEITVTSIEMYFVLKADLSNDIVVDLQNPQDMPFNVVREGRGFLGWYANPEFTGNEVTSYPGYKLDAGVTKVTYYANWGQSVYIGSTGYESISAAVLAAKAGDVITLAGGVHEDAFTINKNNLTFKSAPGVKAVVKSIITATVNIDGLKFEGLEFTGGAYIHMSDIVNNFVFINNYVHDLTLEPTEYKPGKRTDVNAFIRLYYHIEGGGNVVGNVTIEDNEFKNIEADIISITRTADKQINIRNNVFHNFSQTAVRFDGGYNNGVYNITGNTFKHDVKGANMSVIVFRAYAPEAGKTQTINIKQNDFINVGNTSVDLHKDGDHYAGSGVIAFGMFNDQPNTKLYINENLFKGTARAIHFRGLDGQDYLTADFSNNVFEDNDDYYLYQADSNTQVEANFKGNVFKDASGNVITDNAILASKIINNTTYDVGIEYKITYNFGQYGYISDKTKEELFEDFVTDWKAAYARGNTVEVIMGNFFPDGLPTTAVIETMINYKDGKWQWLFDYLIDLAESDPNFENTQNLKEGHTGAWRGTFHGFWNNVDYIFSGVGFTKSMDFTNPQYANGFWQVSPYGKEVEDFVGGGALFNGNSITSWDNTYKFDGWYLNADFSGSALTKLPESVNDNITLYAKWVKK